jgi:hypothetical protein
MGRMAGSDQGTTRTVKRAAALTGGGALVVVGVALLILPGPGLLLVFAGLYVLAQQFPSMERYADMVRDRALAAADESVSSPARIAASTLGGLGLVAAGAVWGLYPSLPFGGWSTGSSLILSGLVVLGLIVYSYRRARDRSAGR